MSALNKVIFILVLINLINVRSLPFDDNDVYNNDIALPDPEDEAARQQDIAAAYEDIEEAISSANRAKRSVSNYKKPCCYYQDDGPSDDIFINFIIQNFGQRLLRYLSGTGQIRRYKPVQVLIRRLVEEFVKNSPVYKMITNQAPDTIDIIDTIQNNYLWRQEIKGKNGARVLVLDLFVENFIRRCFQWLCSMRLLTTSFDPEQIVAKSMQFLKLEEVYKILVKRNIDYLGVMNFVSEPNWWLKPGIVTRDQEDTQWSLPGM